MGIVSDGMQNDDFFQPGTVHPGIVKAAAAAAAERRIVPKRDCHSLDWSGFVETFLPMVIYFKISCF